MCLERAANAPGTRCAIPLKASICCQVFLIDLLAAPDIGSGISYLNNSSAVICLPHFRAYILSFNPNGVTKVVVNVFVVPVTFLKVLILSCIRSKYDLSISYAVSEYFISQTVTVLSLRSISRSIWAPVRRSSSSCASVLDCSPGQYAQEQGLLMIPHHLENPVSVCQ